MSKNKTWKCTQGHVFHTPRNVVPNGCPRCAMGAGVSKLNDAPILGQLDGEWIKIAALMMYVLQPKGATLRITSAQIEQMHKEWPDGANLFCHGTFDGIELKLVSREEAERLAEHQKTQEGSAGNPS